jgi:hypothetical protein
VTGLLLLPLVVVGIVVKLGWSELLCPSLFPAEMRLMSFAKDIGIRDSFKPVESMRVIKEYGTLHGTQCGILKWAINEAEFIPNVRCDGCNPVGVKRGRDCLNLGHSKNDIVLAEGLPLGDNRFIHAHLDIKRWGFAHIFNDQPSARLGSGNIWQRVKGIDSGGGESDASASVTLKCIKLLAGIYNIQSRQDAKDESRNRCNAALVPIKLFKTQFASYEAPFVDIRDRYEYPRYFLAILSFLWELFCFLGAVERWSRSNFFFLGFVALAGPVWFIYQALCLSYFCVARYPVPG